jgi:hypothetical protein
MTRVAGRARCARGVVPGAALLGALLAAGCATTAVDPTQPTSVREHAMSPYVVHEECRRVGIGERIEYWFTSTFPVDFNIHYHESGAVVMPIVRDKAREDGGVFVARIAQDYCLMWEAGPAGTTLDYGLRVRPPAAAQ